MAKVSRGCGIAAVVTAIAVVCAVIVWPLLAGGAASAPIAKDRFTVTDGDTIHLTAEQFGTRLVGFNAPETDPRNAQCAAEAPLGKRATDRLRSLIYSAKVVELTKVTCSCPPGTQGTDRCNHSRSCGVLRVDGRDVGPILIGEGLASPLNCGATSCPPLSRPWCN